jgi:hypothetical protein
MRGRLLWCGLAGSVVLLAVMLALSLLGDTGEKRVREVARRWVEVNDWHVRDCKVVGSFSEGYLDAHQVSQAQCEEDRDIFFQYWFTESLTAGSSFELVDVNVQGETAVVDVEEHGGKVPHLRLFLVFEESDWRIEAVGARP